MILIGKKVIDFSMSNVEDLNNTIPVGNWLVRFNEFSKQFFLEKMDDFVLPVKLYGDVDLTIDRYLNTFNSQDKNLGIALTGLKGTGKSALAKGLCIKSKLPVIVVTEEFSGSEFSSFLGNIKQEAIVFIDEFEKIYEERAIQESFLSILDGVFMGKKIFLFTSNETSKYSNYLINRPGRVHYMKNYERISDEVLDDILKDNLDNQNDSVEFKEIINLIEDANIDMVFALCRECNLYKENPKTSVKHLNIRVTNNSNYSLSILNLKTQKEYVGNLNHSPMLPIYQVYADMEDHVYDKLTKTQQNDPKNYPYSINIRINSNKFKKEQIGRDVTLTNKDYKITAKPVKEYSYVF